MDDALNALPRHVRPGRRALFFGTGGVVLIALFLAGFLPRHLAQKRLAAATAAATATGPTVTVVHPTLTDPRRELTLPGNLQALEATAVYARATGYVRSWLVDIGDHVTQGQLLAELDTPDLDQQLQQARHTLSQSRASLEQAQANQQYADLTAKRYEGLIEEQAVSQQELDQTRSQAAVGLANVHAAQASISAQSAAVRQLEDLKSFARVTAPFAGVITARNVERGTLVTSGTTTGRPIFMLAITNPLRVFVQVPQPFSAGLEVGSPVTVRVRQYPGRDFPGQVTRFSGALDPAARTLTVEAQIANDAGELLPGAYGEVTLTATHAARASVVPIGALIFDAQGTRVATVDAHSRVHLAPVTVGRDLGNQVEIVSGLAENENVIASPPATLVEGMAVTSAPPGR